MYKLTLTRPERMAIDGVGHRYSHGDLLYAKLCTCDCDPDNKQWNDDVDLTFTVPEHVAWEINDIGEESNFLWDCFSHELANKLNEWCGHIV